MPGDARSRWQRFPSRLRRASCRFRPSLEIEEKRILLTSFLVTNTGDSGTGSLRQAIVDSNGTPGRNEIDFAIPASNAANLDVPVPGFDPVNQTWTITLQSPLPAITNPVTIDGYSQAQFPVPFRYPSALSLAIQTVTVLGSPTGGSFTLSTLFPLPVGTTQAIPFNANAGTVQAALEAVIGAGNVTVTGGPAPDQPFTVTFGGQFARQILLPLQWTSNLTGGTNPGVNVETVSVGGTPIEDPKSISSSPNTIRGLDGNNAQVRVIVDGSHTNGGTGFVLDKSQIVLRGLIIDGFGVGVSVPNPGDVGDSIQGNYIGKYLVHPVNAETGEPLAAPNDAALAGHGNSLQGIVVNANNTAIGGTNPQESNLVSGNGQQGILIQPSGTGNIIQGNEIGVIAASSTLYAQVGNHAEGVLIFGASNEVGGPAATAVQGTESDAGNVISGNGSHGIRISGTTATRNIIAGNFIGLAPGGGYKFGTGDPGNGDAGDGVRIEDAPQNQVGGPDLSWSNVISSNRGSGVYVTGASATGNTVLFNFIGLLLGGGAVKGNDGDGVTVLAPQTTVGPGNTISGNKLGVLVSGTTGAVIRDNLIGTNNTIQNPGTIDFGNSIEGVRIENATDAAVLGNGIGSQVISGNLIGVHIVGASASGNLVAGNLIGSDKSGLHALANAQEGVLIDFASGNTIGGTTAAARNLISANHWGLRIQGAGASSNVVEGNLIGTDLTGQAPLPNEVDGVMVFDQASKNLIGGSAAAAGNTIAFNVGAGVNIESGVSNSVLTNSIFGNGGLGIALGPGANDDQPAPMLSSVQSSSVGTIIQGQVLGASSTLYVVQFFSNASSRPEGKTFLGQTTVVTDGSGSATFTAMLPVTLDPSQQSVTATATIAPTKTMPPGDTSEFSGSMTPTAVSVAFASPTYTVNQTAGTVTLTVVRFGGGPGTVAYVTSNGSAAAGVDYVAASGVLSFAAGETQKTISVAILNTGVVGGSKTFFVSLSNPTGGMTLGSPSVASVSILGYTTSGPRVVDLQLLSDHRGLTGIVLKFNEPLDPARAVNLLNYNYSVRAAGNDQKFGTLDDLLFGLSSATYDPLNQTVTLRLETPVRCNSFIQLTINQLTDIASEPVGVSDTAGNLLDGNNDGRPGGVFQATFATGRHLTFVDGTGNLVGLRLSGTGTMQLIRRADGSAWKLVLVGSRPGRTRLSGQVRPVSPGATTTTVIPSIVGSVSSRGLLPDPPFIVGDPSGPVMPSASPLLRAHNGGTARRGFLPRRPV
jgi:hypothetical protein